MSSVSKQVAGLLPIRVKRLLREAVHPAQRFALQRMSRLRGPKMGLLSVVIPVFNVAEYLPACLDSVMSQSYTALEIIVVDDGSTDDSLRVAKEYARWDRRIKVMTVTHGGNGRARNLAIASATGEFLTFADSDDVVAEDAYLTLMAKISESGSDFVVGSSDRLIGKKHVATKLSTRLHERERIGIRLRDFPEILDDVFLWNKLFRLEFWNTQVAPMPEGVLYEDQEATARAFLRARSFDVLTASVYSWRQRPGSSSITQGKGELQNLRDRLRVANEVTNLMLSEGITEEIEVWYRRLFGSDLIPYFDLVANRGDDYWTALSSAVRDLTDKFGRSMTVSEETRSRIDPHARVFQELAYRGLRYETELVIEERINWGNGFEILSTGRGFFALTSYSAAVDSLEEIRTLRCDPNLLEYESSAIMHESSLGKERYVVGHAFIRGLTSDADHHKIQCIFLLDNGKHVRKATQINDNQRINIKANDGFANHEYSEFRVDLSEELWRNDIVSVKVQLEIGESKWAQIHDLIPPREVSNQSLLTKSKQPAVYDFHVDIDNDRFTIFVSCENNHSHFDVYLSTARVKILPAKTVKIDSCRTSYTFEMKHTAWGRSVMSYPTGSYTFRYSPAKGEKEQSIHAVERMQLEDSIIWNMEYSRIRYWTTKNNAFAVSISPPLDILESSKYGRTQIQRKYFTEKSPVLRNHIVVESFAGKTISDNPRAIADEINIQYPNEKIYFSIADFSVPFPSYGTALIRGSRLWCEFVSSAKILINNNNFPHYFRVSEGQSYIQTWHGTPLKRIGRDAPTHQLSVSYRRLMDREAMSWTVLLAQNDFSAKVLPEAFGYEGEVLTLGYPRNDVLSRPIAAYQKDWVRSAIGIEPGKRVILYAPTWRDDDFDPSFGIRKTNFFDFDAAAEVLDEDVVILYRGHHNSSLDFSKFSSSLVFDVTDYPDLNDLIHLSDVLVTDYSSIMFDYSCTEKPIIYLVPDFDKYRDQTRGFYFSDIAPMLAASNQTFEQTLVSINRSLADPTLLQKESIALKNKYANLDCNVAPRLVEFIYSSERFL